MAAALARLAPCLTLATATWQPLVRGRAAVQPASWPSRRRAAVGRAAHDECDMYEQRALSGIWDTSLELDDGPQRVTCHLAERGALTTTASLARGPAWERWEASVERESGSVRMDLRLGPWTMSGKGVRTDGLRCRSVTGSVLEGGDDPVCVGSFSMVMQMPAADEAELSTLERSHLAKVEARPAPPPRFARGVFRGNWRLLIAFEDTDAPSVFSVRLGDDLKFASVPAEQLASVPAEQVEAGDEAGVEPRLGGSWGVWDGSHVQHDKQRARAAASRGMASLGTHFFMRVERERCTSTLCGLANLPVHEGFSLWGKPTIGSAQAELDARSAAGGSTDLVTGHCYFGTSADREWYTCGRFSLLRDTDQPVMRRS